MMLKLKEDEEIIIEEKTKPWKVVAFVAAFIVAIVALTIGFTGLGKKSEGYQTVEAEGDEEASLYSYGINLQYYLTGSSNDIKAALKDISSKYSSELKRAYKHLTSDQEFEGYVNAASINALVGRAYDSVQARKESATGGNYVSSGAIKVSPELYAILTDAYTRTQSGEGYNMFAGAIYALWNSILPLDNAADFDPVNDSDMAVRLRKLVEATNDASNFEFILSSDSTVELRVSASYIALLDELEVPNGSGYYSIIDLNLLKDAYLVDWVSSQLEAAGYSDGYFETSSGLLFSMSGNNRGEYCIYSFDTKEGSDGSIKSILTESERLTIKGGLSVSLMRNIAASDNESNYYYVNNGGQPLFRSQYVSAKTGMPSCIFINSYAISETAGIVDTCYRNVIAQGAVEASETDKLSTNNEIKMMFGK